MSEVQPPSGFFGMFCPPGERIHAVHALTTTEFELEPSGAQGAAAHFEAAVEPVNIVTSSDALVTTSFFLLVVGPGAPVVSLLLVAMPLLLVILVASCY